MKKIIIISILLFALFISASSVYAGDVLNNQSLTTDDVDLTVTQEIENDEIISTDSSEISISDENYDQYFNKVTGKFKSDADASKINTLKIGNVSDKLFTIDKPLNIMPLTKDSEIRNGVIHLIQGSDGSNITGLTINNTVGDIYVDGVFVSKLHGIWLTNSSYNLISNNTIRIADQEGCYAMPMSFSNYNRIFYNDMLTHFTCCMVMGECSYNNISYNKLETLTSRIFVCANPLYLANAYGHADYDKVRLGTIATGNYVSNNYIKCGVNDMWSVALINSAGISNTTIINNTIIQGCYGIYIDSGLYSRNISIIGNTIINSSNSIQSISNNVIISNNKIIGSSMEAGIITVDSPEQNITVCDNYIEYENLYYGIITGVISGNEFENPNGTLTRNTKVHNNKIIISNYGVGISTYSNTIVSKNLINVVGDDGIRISGNNTFISDNIITTKSRGVSLVAENRAGKMYNNTIFSNRISSDDYAVYVAGYVYNTTIKDNIIDTNQSEGIYINIMKTFEDRNPGNIIDNRINGVLEYTDAIIINDNNFYDYFDEDGYLKYEFNSTQKRMFFFTFLSNKNIYFTDQIALSSNNQPNLLYNVSITLKGDACDSSISDIKFYNFDKSSIILDGVENVNVNNNEFTTLASDIFDISAISIIGGCANSQITNNDIFIYSNSDYSYGISISEPIGRIAKRFSKNITVSNNNILIKSSGVSEGIYFDALSDSIISLNDISISCDDSAYGIASANVFGTPHDIKIDSNEIIIISKEMSYLIELYMSESIEITNNYLKGTSNGIYGVGVYNSKNISVDKNEIVVVGKELTDNRVLDSLGKGNAAIYVNRSSTINSISKNIFDIDNCDILSKDKSTVKKFANNFYVVSNYNRDFYFNSQNVLISDLVKQNDVILFKNFTDSNIIEINTPVLIKPYKHLNQFNAYLILSGDYSNLELSGFKFTNATLKLDDVTNVNIVNNSFISSKIIIDNVNNSIINNSFEFSDILFDNSFNTKLIDNTLNNTFILVKKSNSTIIYNNLFNLSTIISNSSIYNNISYNTLIGNNHVYSAFNSSYDQFLNNIIDVNSENARYVVYYDENSSNNEVMYNRIISNSIEGKDYAVMVDTNSDLLNIIANNYLISSNGFKRGNDAVYALNELVINNTPADLYVSVNGNESGDGSFENPYPTIAKALENALSGAIIYVLPGYYNESNLVIDKNITLTAINQEGNTYIDALNNRLFNITKTGSLTVNALKIFNGYSVEGGSLFLNMGNLIVNNSIIYNSSSYYDNSHPTFTKDKYDKRSSHTYNCENLGLGGAILNYGNLLINSSNLFDNFAHKGGAIADFGKTTILNSLIYNNIAVHGGAIYTDSKKEFTVNNTHFLDNLAITTLDYCYIHRVDSSPDNVPIYSYSTECDMGCGYGGAIYSNSIVTISNSLFEGNVAKSGGAIATDTNIESSYGYHDVDYTSYGLRHIYANTKLTIDNSTFRANEAKNTFYGNLSLLYHRDFNYYNKYFQGGAIFGSFKELNIYDSLFENNVAHTDGGALCVQCENSTIEGSRFYNNTAGKYGGALSIFGDSMVFNTEIINNSAQNGGALHYASYEYYNHIENNMDMFNVTVSGNKALDKGGAFNLRYSNFNIRNSNIYGNKAPTGDTFYGGYNVDARSNWWGSVNGPDKSIYNVKNIKVKAWLSDRVKWDAISISSSKENEGNGNGKNSNGRSYNPADSSTGSGVRTGSTLTSIPKSSGNNGNHFNFPGNWPSSSSGNGNYGRFNVNGIRFGGNTLNNSKTSVKGNIFNPNSMSKVNSSNVNDLSSVGMTANAADSSPSSQSSSSEGGDGGDSARAYEITKEIKDIDKIVDSPIYIILFIILFIMFFIGFYRKYKSEE